jgi:hypothetical protein
MQISSRKGNFSMHALLRGTVLASLFITLLFGGSWGLTLTANAQAGTTLRVSVASDGTGGNRAGLFGAGQYVPFQSGATHLVKNDPNGQQDVFGREQGLLHAVFVPLILRSDTLNLPCGNQDSEPNNRFSEAVAQPLLCPATQLTGTANRKIDLVDFFRVNVEQTATLQIDLTNLPPNSDFDLYLYNETGLPQGVGSQSGSQNEQIRVSATPGRYFIGVYAIVDDPNSTTYTLRWVAE